MFASFVHSGRPSIVERLCTLPTTRVLVVEDFAPFRRYVCAALTNMRNVEVVGEASDGAEAVRKAVELKPDLILLDIGLPKLNGIEVARQVRELAPQSRIIFLSQESSPDIIQEALRSGGLGYITKIMAGIELLPAVKSVVSGRLFVGNSPVDGNCILEA